MITPSGWWSRSTWRSARKRRIIQFANIHEFCANPNMPTEDAATAEARARECRYKRANDDSNFYEEDDEDEDDEGDEDEAEDEDEADADDESELMDEDIQADPKPVPSAGDAHASEPPSDKAPSSTAAGSNAGPLKTASDGNPTTTPSESPTGSAGADP